jgi:hypothetical protein
LLCDGFPNKPGYRNLPPGGGPLQLEGEVLSQRDLIPYAHTLIVGQDHSYPQKTSPRMDSGELRECIPVPLKLPLILHAALR